VTEQVDVVTQQVFVILLHGHVPEHAGEFIHLGGDDLDQEDAVAEALLLAVWGQLLAFAAVDAAQQQLGHAGDQLVTVAGVERKFANEVRNQFTFVFEQIDLAWMGEHKVDSSWDSQRVML